MLRRRTEGRRQRSTIHLLFPLINVQYNKRRARWGVSHICCAVSPTFDSQAVWDGGADWRLCHYGDDVHPEGLGRHVEAALCGKYCLGKHSSPPTATHCLRELWVHRCWWAEYIKCILAADAGETVFELFLHQVIIYQCCSIIAHY